MIQTLFNLIKQTSCFLPSDVHHLLSRLENNNVVKTMQETLNISASHSMPICQDTGFPYFYITLPIAKAPLIPSISSAIQEALKKATQKGILRPNSVNPLTGENFGNNLGLGLPYIDWEFLEDSKAPITCYLLLKGGGSENASAQYALPFAKANASRDLKGVVKVILYHLHQIQGQGCAPGILGIGLGGDRISSFKLAKKQLLNPFDNPNPDPALALLEEEIVKKANQLNIGVMGLGQGSTLLAAKIGALARHPASFFVSISYLCWVARRGSCLLPIS